MYTVVGFRRVTAKKDGVQYVELHLIGDDRFVTGKACEKCFVRLDMIHNADSLALDSLCSLSYNKFGRIDSVLIHI